MKFSTPIEKFPGAGMHYIQVPAKTAASLRKKGVTRVLCRINNTLELHAALMHTKEGMSYIMLGKRWLTEIKAKAGTPVSVTLQEDETELQFDIPEEFSAVMESDPGARKIFDALTDGRKRGLIQLVRMVKSSDKKIERALKIAEKIKFGITSPQQIMKS
jgi:uncharacterized protein YdeI (YjbR/CyaY-like superfamily)